MLDEATPQSETHSPIKPKCPVGRPTTYKPEICDKVIELGAEGMSLAEICAEIGIWRSTMQEWEAKHPEFSVAIRNAKFLEMNWWERKSRLNLENSNFNHALWDKSVRGRFSDTYRENKQQQTPQTVVYVTDGALNIQPKS